MYTIERGNGMALKFGFPTANVSTLHDEDPGIFIGEVHLEFKTYDALIYTSAKNLRLTECHLFNFHEDVYGKLLSFTKLYKIRDDVHYKTLDETIYHIHIDILISNICLNILNDLKNVSAISVSFSGGKEACILLKFLDILKINYDVVHFKPKNLDILDFVKTYSLTKSLTVFDYEISMKEVVMQLDESHQVSFLGVRKSDFNGSPKTYQNNWLTKCKVLTPLYNLTYNQVWDIIKHLNIHVSDLYSFGYTSVGYYSKPNELLNITGTDKYLHASTLKNFQFERI
jgi:hypothetical protein